MAKLKEMKGVDKEWAIKDAASTLIRAEEIKADDELYQAALKHLKAEQVQREKVLKSVYGRDK